MFAGTLIMEDVVITFTIDTDNVAHATIYDTHSNIHDVIDVPGQDFMAALSIAVHWEGNPNAELDYPKAESVQRNIRWIP